MRLPPKETLDTAIAWLRANEGDSGEMERCTAVADWLEAQEFENMLRTKAREGGVTMARLRRRIASL